jgi:hypothetical protein
MPHDIERPRTCGGGASHPARVILSNDKLRKFHPELFGVRGCVKDVSEWVSQKFYAFTRTRIREWLYHGDSRAAVVVCADPLLVACYTDEMDCVVMLRFPDGLAEEYALREGSRLLSANAYMVRKPERALQPDLVDGPKSTFQHALIFPFITDFLSDDLDRIAQRKAEISRAEWSRAASLADAYLERPGCTARDGRPLYCGISKGEVIEFE